MKITMQELHSHSIKSSPLLPIPRMSSIEQWIIRTEQGHFMDMLALLKLYRFCKAPTTAAETEVIEVIKYTLETSVEGFEHERSIRSGN
jgi:hypothetical protein